MTARRRRPSGEKATLKTSSPCFSGGQASRPAPPVPDAGCAVAARDGDIPVVATENWLEDPVRMFHRCRGKLAIGHVPGLELAVASACRQPLAVVRDRRTVEAVVMSQGRISPLARGDVPDLRRSIAGGNQGPAIRGEFQVASIERTIRLMDKSLDDPALAGIDQEHVPT